MARKRQIDPAIWTNEQFCNLSFNARLLFVGMISNADDEGRLKGSAKYLKMVVFPSDPSSIDDLIKLRAEVIREKLATHYAYNNNEYLELPTFIKHQYMTKRYPSSIPSPQSVNCQLITDTQPFNNQLFHNDNDIGIGIDNGNGVYRPDKKIKATKVILQEIVDLYNSICVALPKVQRITETRKHQIINRFDENPDIEIFKKVFNAVNSSDFLSQKTDRKFSCGFDWIIKPSNFIKILEGNYDNQTKNNGHKQEVIKSESIDSQLEKRGIKLD
jgi:hypothetical protein